LFTSKLNALYPVSYTRIISISARKPLSSRPEKAFLKKQPVAS
jgi:hypothetical protein